MAKLGKRDVDFALDCNDCGRIFVFGTREERDAELVVHQDHETDLFLQARV